MSFNRMPRQAQRYVVVILLACHLVSPFYSLHLFLLYQQEDEEDLPSSPFLLNRSLLVSFPSTLASPRSMPEHSPSQVASPVAKACSCCIACLSLGSSFSLTFFFRTTRRVKEACRPLCHRQSLFVRAVRFELDMRYKSRQLGDVIVPLFGTRQR